MPTISVIKQDLERLAGKTYELPELERALEYAKAEVKVEGDELRVQLKDTNRPDLWCTEGLGRALKGYREGVHDAYDFFTLPGDETRRIDVDATLEHIRPYVSGFVCSGVNIDDDALKQVIETQERLTDNYGRGRSSIAIGIYDASDIVYPIRYEAVSPNTRFTPLEATSEMSLRQILAEHPTGQTYAHLLEGFESYPLLRDARDEVLSMPPIINSASLGRVEVGDSHLFFEATGTVLDHVLHAIAIFSANLADRGGTIEPVTTHYPYDTPRGRQIQSPLDMSTPITATLDRINETTGTPLALEQIESALTKMAYRSVHASENRVTATPPPYRDDLLHPVDMIEDIIIGVGYETFDPMMPRDFTIGKAAPQEDLSDRIRHLLVGCGFQELFLPILGSVENQTTRIRNEDAPAIVIANPMSEHYGCARWSLIPGLLSVEETSRRAIYPHRLFEVGEVARKDPDNSYGSRTDILATVMEASEDASLSAIQSYLEALAYYSGFDYELRPLDHPTYLPGRAGEIVSNGQVYGMLGEIHPEVLDNWGIAVPVSTFEVDIAIADQT
jgi:phenylalanyl-tRNA synthetase beta chain